MKYTISPNGYYYKVYNNGRKVRISKQIFDSKNIQKGAEYIVKTDDGYIQYQNDNIIAAAHELDDFMKAHPNQLKSIKTLINSGTSYVPPNDATPAPSQSAPSQPAPRNPFATSNSNTILPENNPLFKIKEFSKLQGKFKKTQGGKIYINSTNGISLFSTTIPDSVKQNLYDKYVQVNKNIITNVFKTEPTKKRVQTVIYKNKLAHQVDEITYKALVNLMKIK